MESTTATPCLDGRVKDAVRLAFFVRIPEERLRASWMAILAAAFVAICVPTVYALATIGVEGRWNPFSATGALFFMSVFLVGTVIVCRVVKRDDAVPALLFATMLAWIVIDIISLSVWATLYSEAWTESMPGLQWLLFVLPLAWLAFAVARAGLSLGPVKWGRRVAATVASLAFIAMPLAIVNPDRALWSEDWSRKAFDDSSRWGPAQEQAFYRQPELLAGALAAVEQGRPGVVDVFFLGMAGYGYQDVFMREVDAVADLMRERFDAEGRVVKLVNNPKTVLSTPIATLTSLQRALERTAARMDAEEDVLVLFLTSHGSAEHKFSMDLYPMRLKEIDPPALRKALDDSGIRNRIVIISACYSGGFAKALEDPHTLVIAAAAPDRNSFGCSNEAEWTYFGNAYFNEALRETHSFTRAFELAAPAIEKREKAEGFDPSLPVMRAGAEIGRTLEQLERRLAASGNAKFGALGAAGR